jgi:predicted nucleic acid-binding protein
VIFVDANVPMYLVGAGHPNKVRGQHLLERLTGEGRRLVTSSEVFQEILHRYVATGRRPLIELAFATLGAIVDDVLAVELADVLAAKALVHAHPRLSARDALHAAVMQRRQISEILTFDSGFDEVTGIRRIPAATSGA